MPFSIAMFYVGLPEGRPSHNMYYDQDMTYPHSFPSSEEIRRSKNPHWQPENWLPQNPLPLHHFPTFEMALKRHLNFIIKHPTSQQTHTSIFQALQQKHRKHLQDLPVLFTNHGMIILNMSSSIGMINRNITIIINNHH